jgi:hypothetical protein
MNNTRGEMHAGTRRLVVDLRAKYPNVLACGEMSHGELLAFIPLDRLFAYSAYPEGFKKYARAFEHLSHPAPGRGSSGVHESGLGRFDPKRLSLNEHRIPTLNIVDDSFDKCRDLMAAVIERA